MNHETMNDDSMNNQNQNQNHNQSRKRDRDRDREGEKMSDVVQTIEDLKKLQERIIETVSKIVNIIIC